MVPVPSAASSSSRTDPATSASEAEIELITGNPGSGWMPPDAEAVQAFLGLFGKAVRHFQTLPAHSPICVEAIAVAHAALVGLVHRERLTFRVGPTRIMIDDVVPIADSGSALELARRLHRVQVAVVEIARSATLEELARFGAELGTFREATRSVGGFVPSWTGHGIDRITVRASHRPVVIEAGTPQVVAQQLVNYAQRHQHEQAAVGGQMYHLYPPDRGWVRVDPSVTAEAASLVDLAMLLDDPVELAVAMTRLTDEEGVEEVDPATAFTDRFSELATLFSRLEPDTGELLFSKLARSLLDLDEPRRLELLRQTVLPGLLDGKLEGSVLASFPDLALADSLCLLLDLETAAPELLATAMDRLALPRERREVIAPLLRHGLAQRRTASISGNGLDVAVDRFAQRLIALDPSVPRHFGDFVAFDLTVTDQTREETCRIASRIEETDLIDTHFETICPLIGLEPESVVAVRYLEQVGALFDDVLQAGRWGTVADWARRLRAMATTLETGRPEVAEAIAAELRKVWTPERLAELATAFENGSLTPAEVGTLVDHFSAELAPVIVASLDNPVTADRAARLLPLLMDRAAAVVPPLLPQLSSATGASLVAIIRLLGHAGPAFGGRLAALLAEDDVPTVREALAALARMGSSAAAIAVAEHVATGPAATRAAAAEALLRFPPARRWPRVRALIENRAFVRQNPGLTLQILKHVSDPDDADLEPALRALTSLRFHIWNPAIVRVAREATRLLRA